MDIRSYRAATMQEALAMVRRELGPTAAVLHTREIGGGALVRWIPGVRKIEVTASVDVPVPSRLPPREAVIAAPAAPQPVAVREAPEQPAATRRAAFQDDVSTQLSGLQAMVEDLCRRSQGPSRRDLPEALFRLYADLIEAEISEDIARELIERLRVEAPGEEIDDPVLAKARIARMIEADIHVSGPIAPTSGRRHLVALVGPTGVGKTTTIAKLAANFRLREKRSVGLITVDTYRIAAVEQLRTYADIIDLPMHVVSTPREMREAVAKMSNLDLILLDTAGRSPKDDVKIQELRAFLAEAKADEVHLVLSSVASAATLERTAERFAAVGATSLVLTKLDEATSYGNLLPVLRTSRLPLSYLTDGQNVPDDIEAAESRRLAKMIMALDES